MRHGEHFTIGDALVLLVLLTFISAVTFLPFYGVYRFLVWLF